MLNVWIVHVVGVAKNGAAEAGWPSPTTPAAASTRAAATLNARLGFISLSLLRTAAPQRSLARWGVPDGSRARPDRSRAYQLRGNVIRKPSRGRRAALRLPRRPRRQPHRTVPTRPPAGRTHTGHALTGIPRSGLARSGRRETVSSGREDAQGVRRRPRRGHRRTGRALPGGQARPGRSRGPDRARAARQGRERPTSSSPTCRAHRGLPADRRLPRGRGRCSSRSWCRSSSRSR